jgi:GGDEF domain-containing protein
LDDGSPAPSREALLREVDQAMYAAKKMGGGRHSRFCSKHSEG